MPGLEETQRILEAPDTNDPLDLAKVHLTLSLLPDLVNLMRKELRDHADMLKRGTTETEALNEKKNIHLHATTEIAIELAGMFMHMDGELAIAAMAMEHVQDTLIKVTHDYRLQKEIQGRAINLASGMFKGDPQETIGRLLDRMRSKMQEGEAGNGKTKTGNVVQQTKEKSAA